MINKLVRDKIPEILKNQGKQYKTQKIPPNQIKKHLINKLNEEVTEFNQQPSIEEIIDILEILRSLIIELGSNVEEIEQKRIEKYNELGGFEKRIFLKYHV